MSILITEPKDYSDLAITIYKKLGPVLLGKPPIGFEKKVSILVVRLSQNIDSAYLSKYPSVKAIVSPTTGLNHIDILACEKKRIKIFSLQNCKEAINDVTSTSELTLGLIIALLRKIPQAHYNVIYKQQWERDAFKSRQLSNLSLGIIGLGRIGGHLAKYARVLGMNVSAYDPFQNDQKFKLLSIVRKSLDSLIHEADVISINADLRHDNHNLISTREILLMQKHALIINTARGALLDEFALASAIKRGNIGGAAVDVLSDEHSSKTSLFSSPLVQIAKQGFNVIITPHLGGCTIDAMQSTEIRLAETFVENLSSLL